MLEKYYNQIVDNEPNQTLKAHLTPFFFFKRLEKKFTDGAKTAGSDGERETQLFFFWPTIVFPPLDF